MHVIKKNQNHNKPAHTQKQQPKSTQNENAVPKKPTKILTLNLKKKG